MKARNLVFALGALGLVVVAQFLPTAERLGGLSLDLLFWVRHEVGGPRWHPSDSPTVVLAIDEETFRTAPFNALPQAVWSRELAQVTSGLVAADVKVLAFDVIFPTSIEPLLPGFERDFLRALRGAAEQERVVLAKVQHQQLPISPSRGQSIAVRAEENVRAVNLFRDPDEMIRRVPLFFDSEDGGGGVRQEPSFGLEIAARMLGTKPRRDADGRVALGSRVIAGSETNNLLVNFDGGGGDIPTFALVDILRCVQAGDAEFLKRHFAGKAVLVGAIADVEDRKLTSRRFINGPEGAGYGPRCVLPARTDLIRRDVVRDTIPGVYVHAAMINNLLRSDELVESPRWHRIAAIGGVAAIAAIAGFVFSASGAAIATAVVAMLWAGIALHIFRQGLVLPLIEPGLAAGIVLAMVLGYRFSVTDRDKRALRRNFALYLPPAIVDRIAGAAKPPVLGGETRELTVVFTDLAGFTRAAEGMPPDKLVTLMNLYLDAMTEIIEAHGGFVDKYIGDAIVAVFGAPLDEPRHARRAVECVIACQERLSEMNRADQFGGIKLKMRAGLNSGPALIGNIGSRRRFNYTVMGDTVNLAARLESANKHFGTLTLVAGATREAAAARAGETEIAWREIDRVRVVGRGEPVSLYEPLGFQNSITLARQSELTIYAQALAQLRAGDPGAAMATLQANAHDEPSISLRKRAERYFEDGIRSDWDGVTTLTDK
jgi:class 3 adenylate cyclase/CHASE2 domain-containing sensor protein